MTCTHNCDQGRTCTCDYDDTDHLVTAILLIVTGAVAVALMALGCTVIYHLMG